MGNNNMNNLKTMFTAADKCLPIDEQRKSETLNLLYHVTASIENRPLQNRKQLLLNLLRYADRNLAGMHLLVCAAMLLLLFTVNTWNINAATTVLLSMMIPSFLACLSAFEVRQICFAKMAELSKTCFFHVSQLAALSMALSGILNLIAVSAGILLVGSHWKLKLLHAGIYILVPFTFMQCICFGTILTEAGRKYTWLSAVPGIPVAFLCLVIVQNRTLYTESALCFWTAALVVGIAILITEVRTLFVKLGKGDILCTN